MRSLFHLANFPAVLALLCASSVTFAQVSPGGAISGSPANASFRSVRINTTASGCTTLGTLCIGGSGGNANFSIATDGTGWFANQDLVIGSNGTIAGNGRWDIRNGTSGEWMRFNADSGTNGYLNFRSNNVTVGKIGSSSNLFADGAQNFGVIAGTGKQLIFGSPVSVNVESNVFRVAPTTGYIVSSALNNSAGMGEVWCSQSYTGGFRAFMALDALCATMVNASSMYLQVTQTGGTIDNVTLTAGQGGSDKLTLGGKLVDISAYGGTMSIGAGANILMSADGIGMNSGGYTDFTLVTGTGRKLLAQSPTYDFRDLAGTYTATFLVNNSAVCTQATGCPGGAARTWQAMGGARSSGVTYTNSSGSDIEVSIRSSISVNGTVTLTVGGVAIASHGISGGAGAAEHTMSAMIPNGVSYDVSQSGTINAIIWSELRP